MIAGAVHLYQLFGVCFSSDVALDLPPAAPADPVRFAISAAPDGWPPAAGGGVVLDHAEEWTTLRVHASGHVEMEWKDWLRFWVEPDGSRLQYRVREQTYPSAFEAYVANFAVSICLLLQGEEALHSTVVVHHGRGIGFLGESGAGKSTLTAHLIARGAELITDDMLRITTHGDAFHAEPGQPRIKLFEETARRHLPEAINRGRWNPMSEKFLFDVESPLLTRRSRPLHALISLQAPQDGHENGLTLRRLAGLELFHTLIGATMNHRLHTRERLAVQFHFAARIGQSALPVYALHYPRDHDSLPEVVALIERELAG